MDYVEIRLISDDDQSINRLVLRLQMSFPEILFQRMKAGRDGDWLCYGTYDSAASNVRTSTRTDEQAIAAWLDTYDAAIRPMLRARRKGNSLAAMLDDVLSDLKRWLQI